MNRLSRWLSEPQPILRLEIIRILVPLAILGFMSSRLVRAPDWIGNAGFQVPNLGVPDWRQPLYLAPLSPGAAWALVAVMIVAGLALSAGFRARPAALIFAVTLAYVALADRLAAFTVSKMSPVLALAFFFSPCGRAYGVDAWIAARRGSPAPKQVEAASVRFFQALLCTMYCASGVCKMRGDWLVNPFVLWSHLHDSYQTWVAWLLANLLPVFMWPILQAVVLTFEVLAPLWFSWRNTRTMALVIGVGMHAMIAMMFWPVRWFAMLMASMLIGAFLPERAMTRLEAVLDGVGHRVVTVMGRRRRAVEG